MDIETLWCNHIKCKSNALLLCDADILNSFNSTILITNKDTEIELDMFKNIFTKLYTYAYLKTYGLSSESLVGLVIDQINKDYCLALTLDHGDFTPGYLLGLNNTIDGLIDNLSNMVNFDYVELIDILTSNETYRLVYKVGKI